MQTRFTAAQLQDPDVAASEPILRKCVHCGFCTATCPTYVLLGDELDSPRGRIYLIKEMLENDRPASAEVVSHLDRCLSCLACMTTCPSGVHYQHLIDHARVHVEKTYRGRCSSARCARRWPRCCRIRAGSPRRSRSCRSRGRSRALLPARVRAMLELVPARSRPASAAGTGTNSSAHGRTTRSSTARTTADACLPRTASAARASAC